MAQWIRNLPAKAGDTGLIPGPGRFHRQLSLSATTTDARVSQLMTTMHHNYDAHALQIPCSAPREATTVRLCATRKSSHQLLQLEKARIAMQTQLSHK